MLKLLVLSLAVYATLVMAAPPNKITSKLVTLLAEKGTVNALLSMKEDTSSVLDMLNKSTFTSMKARRESVVSTLQSFAERSQKEVIDLLSRQRSATYEGFWISNQIWLKNADVSLLQELAALESVGKIKEEFLLHLDDLIDAGPVEEMSRSDNEIFNEWGIVNVEAPAAWARGFNGSGAVIGIIDTGAVSNHEALSSRYLASCWLDATGSSTEPRDGNGHGSHVTGTIVGTHGIGVAPGARFCSCKGLSDAGSGTNTQLISCGQFMTERGVDAVNCSWGGGQGNTFYNAVIQAWNTAGIVPVFLNGNGPPCRTASAPGDSTAGVIFVGALTNTNTVASFSGKGPSIFGALNPHITAPGSLVRSAWYNSNTAYNTISGSAMASPHVAGIVAILRGRNPNISNDQVRNAIQNNALRNVVPTGYNCGGIPESVFPNNAFGYGRATANGALNV